MTLLEHNQKTLNDVNKYLKQGQNCCIVNPCGSGKTAVMAKIIEENIASTFTIITKQKNAAKYYREKDAVFSNNNVQIVTYNKMMIDFKNAQIEKYNTDFLLIDEAHYLGADKWGQAFDSIYSKYHQRIIGFTATPQRYEDQGTDHDIVTDIFGGNSAGNFSTKELEKQGIFTEPEYVLSIYDLQRIVDEKTERILESDLDDETKNSLFDKLEKILNKWNTESNPEKVLSEYLPKYLYKDYSNRILVYVSDIKELTARKKYIDNVLHSIFPTKKIKSYVYTYMTSEDELSKFLKEDKTEIKILYSIDKIMETIHIDDLRIAIMLRPAVSNRIITQQFGRLNNTNNKSKPLIIDMVDNLSNISTNAPNTIFGSHNERTANRNVNMDLPHISYYNSVFSQIDKALSRGQAYSYRGVIGSLGDICKIYCKNYEIAKELIKTYDIIEVMNKTPSTKIQLRQDILDGEYKVPDFSLTEEQRHYAEEHLHLVESFITRKNVKDEDLKQTLYMTYLQYINRTDGVYDSDWKRKQRIYNSLQATYTTFLRRNFIRKQYICDFPNEMQYDVDLDANTLQSEADNVIRQVLRTLNPKTRDILLLYFGFTDNQQYALEDIGKMYYVGRDRIRQIVAKGLRTLRSPTRVEMLRPYLDAYDTE